MKRFCLTIALLIALLAAILPGSFAAADDGEDNPVSLDVAKQVAVNQLNKLKLHKIMATKPLSEEEIRELRLETSSVSEAFTITKEGKSIYYVINLNPEGWVIVSADYVAYPIIGCSDTGSLSEENHPPGFDAWMDNVKEEIYQAITQKVAPLEEATIAWQNLDVRTEDFSKELSGESGAVAESIPGIIVWPIIKSIWGQGGNKYWLPWIPTYDKYCPAEKRKKCFIICWWEWQVAPTGCVATAAAQVMRYWKWPPVGEGDHSYDPWSYSCEDTATHKCYGYGTRYVDFSQRYYNWDNMPLLVWSNEIALLMRDLGIAVEMDYSPEGSGAYIDDLAEALQEYFRYHSTYEKRGSTPYNQWSAELRAQLDGGQPLVYGGDPCSGSGMGHAFICDGYSLDFFHFNWGWNGLADGWYLLGALTPLFHNFTCGQEAIFDLQPDYPDDVYVDDDYVKGDSGGHAWGYDAFNNIQDGIDMVEYDGTVWVNPGSYSPIAMKERRWVRAVGQPEVTIIDGSGDRAVTAVNVSSARLSGFTITGGKSSTGAAMYLKNSEVIVEDCVFEDNVATTNGGGMYNLNSSTWVTRCTFLGNSAGGSGGGMYNLNSSPWVTNCIFLQNSATTNGGGMCNINSSPTVTNCSFSGNSAGGSGDGMYNNDSSPTVTNCIFWDESSDEIANAGGATPVITYCDVQGGYSGAGNISEDPMFVNAAGGNVHLNSSSPCIDAGNNEAPSIPFFPDFELDNRRIDDPSTPDTGSGTAPIVDMGADEYTPSRPAAENDIYSVTEDETLDVAHPGVLVNDSDPQQDPLTAVKDTNPTSGTLTFNADGSFTYKPIANFTGTVSFKYHATDGHARSNIATVTINVNSVQDLPQALDDIYSMDEDQTLSIPSPGVLENDKDPEGDLLEAVNDTDPGDGTLTFNHDGSFTYEPNNDYYGTDSFTYHATDGRANSGIATVTIFINPVNDPPVAEAGGPYTGSEGSPVEFDGSGADVDGDILQYRWDFEYDGTWDTEWSANGTANHTWGDNWAGTARVQVSDNELTAEDTANVTVNNVAPLAFISSVEQTNPEFILPVVHTLTFHGEFTDPGWLDTHATLWEFDDGDSTTGTTDEENDMPDATGNSTANHAYAQPGDYLATFTVTDDDSDFGNDTVLIHVASAEEALDILDKYIQALSDDAFDGNARQAKNALANKCSALANMMDTGNYKGLMQKLKSDLRAKADGLVDGSTKNDWVMDIEAQLAMCGMIDDIIAYLESK